MLSADPEIIKKKIEEEIEDESVRVHNSGAIAKLAYNEIKEGRDYLPIFAQYLSDLADSSQSFKSAWPIEVLLKIKGIDFPINSPSLLKEKLKGVIVEGVEIEKKIENLQYPINNPAQLLHQIRIAIEKD